MTGFSHQTLSAHPPTTADRRRKPALAPLKALVVAGIMALAACGSPKTLISDKEEPAETLYNRAMGLLTQGDGIDATHVFNEVERQHPYSIWAGKAILMSSYTYYAMNRYDEASAGFRRFIRLHPGSRDIEYAYYLKALCAYEQIADIQRDQDITRQAMKALQEVIRRFPRTKYARDAQLKYDLTQDQLAGQEMSIGRWYQESGLYIAAINRFKAVVDKFQTTSHVPEALHRLTEVYLTLGIREEAQKTAAVLGHNFPGSEWYRDSYVLITGIKRQRQDAKSSLPRRSWWGRAWNAIF